MLPALLLTCLISTAQPDTMIVGSRVIVQKIVRQDTDPGANPFKDSVNFYYKHPERFRGAPLIRANLFILNIKGDTLSLKQYFRKMLPDFPDSLEVTLAFEVSWNGALRAIVDEYKGKGIEKIDFVALFKPIRTTPAILYGFAEWEKQYLRLSKRWLLSK